MSVRIVATADNHLGSYVAKLPPRTLEQRRQRLRRAFGQVVDAAVERGAQLVVLAGDVFDTPAPRNPERIYVARRLAELRRNGIYAAAVGGNHDAPRSLTEEGGHLALRVYAELDALSFFGYADEDLVIRPQKVRLDGADVAIGGFTPQLNLSSASDPLEGVTFEKSSADLNILITHGIVEGTAPYGVSESIIRQETIARLSGTVDLLIVGDIHRAANFRCGDVEVVVPGATEHTTFDDAYTPGYAWICASRCGTTVEHVTLSPQPRLSVRVSAVDLDAEDPTGDLTHRLDACGDLDAMTRLVIEGVLPREVYRRLNTASIEEHGRQRFFSFDLDLTRLLVRLELIGGANWTQRRTIAEEIRSAIDMQRQSIGTGDVALLDEVERELLHALAQEGEGDAR